MSSEATERLDGGEPARAAPDLAVPLRAGPLRLIFDRGELRWIRLGKREVLRGIYVAVREEGWATVPAALEALEIEAEPDAFLVRFRALHRRGRVRFDWEGRIEGRRDGRVVFSMDGRAGSSFRRNRIGVCVLHPAEACAGRRCIVETTDGDRLEQGFPALVAPHQPFRNVRAILHEVSPGVEAEVRLDGETFETEDQRNWSDDSFKTYGTPLHLPIPVEVREGTRIRQSVTVCVFGVTAEPVERAFATVPGALPKKRNSAEPVAVSLDDAGAAPLPALGLAGAERGVLAEAERERLRALRLAHVRADLRLEQPGWDDALARAVENARALGAPLEVALFLPDDPRPGLEALRQAAGHLRAPVAAWLVYRAVDGTTGAGDVTLARESLGALAPGALVAAGSDAHFAELNRRREAARGADRVVFAMNPQVHAFDDATLFESLGSLDAVARTLRGFSGNASLAVTPATLRPRVDPRPPSSREPGEPPFTDDPRQSGPLAAAWALALVGAAAEAGFASVTLYELAGPRGVLDGDRTFPAFHALADVGERASARVVPVRSRRPERVRAVGLRDGNRLSLFLANVTADPHPVRLEGLSGRGRRGALGAAATADVGPELDLAPREVARVDIDLAE